MNSDKKCVFLDEFLALFTHPGEEEPPSGETGNTKPRTHPPLPVHQVKEGDNGDFIVDESGVRAIIPPLAEREAIGLFKEESKLLREFARDCELTWPVSLGEVRTWAEMMGFEVAGIDEDERFSTGEGGAGQVAKVASPAVHCRLAAKPGRPPTPGMDEAVRDFELRWNKAKQGEDTTPVTTKRGLATEIAKERWPGITEPERNSHIHTLLSRTRAGASVPNEGDTQREGKSEEDPKHLFLSSPPPLSLK